MPDLHYKMQVRFSFLLFEGACGSACEQKIPVYRTERQSSKLLTAVLTFKYKHRHISKNLYLVRMKCISNTDQIGKIWI